MHLDAVASQQLRRVAHCRHQHWLPAMPGPRGVQRPATGSKRAHRFAPRVPRAGRRGPTPTLRRPGWGGWDPPGSCAIAPTCRPASAWNVKSYGLPSADGARAENRFGVGLPVLLAVRMGALAAIHRAQHEFVCQCGPRREYTGRHLEVKGGVAPSCYPRCWLFHQTSAVQPTVPKCGEKRRPRNPRRAG